MSFLSKRKSSGIFIPSVNGYVEYQGEMGNGSINDIGNHLGYNNDQTYTTVGKIDKTEKIKAVIFEIFTRNVVFILVDTKVTFITDKDVQKHLGDFSVNKEFTSLRINNTLSEGIENETLNIEFLSRVLNLKDAAPNGMFYSEKIKTYLYFTNGILTNFQYDDGLFPWAKHLQKVNKTVYKKLADLANKYWPDNPFQAQKEINIQCEAWASIPDAYGNEYLHLHGTENGGANLHMLRVCHYGFSINLEQFMELNHGRYLLIREEQESNSVCYKCGLFLYIFNLTSGELLTSFVLPDLL